MHQHQQGMLLHSFLPPSLVRVADGEVAFEGERDDHEDGGAHRHVRHHVGVLHHRRQALCKINSINTQQLTADSAYDIQNSRHMIPLSAHQCRRIDTNAIRVVSNIWIRIRLFSTIDFKQSHVYSIFLEKLDNIKNKMNL